MSRSRSRLTAACLACVLALAAAGCSREGAPRTAEEEIAVVPVAAAPAQRGRLRAVIQASGTVIPAQDAEFLVVAPEPARILEITKDAGAAVAPGEVVVRFELPTASQEVVRQRADLARLQAQVENARIAQGRMRDFVGRGLVPRTQLDAAERELADAEAALARAQAALAAAEAQAARGTVIAPFAGVVAQRLHEVGDIAQATSADPVLRIVDPTRLEVLATIPRADVARVTPGATARIAGAIDGQTVQLTVAAAPNLADATSDGSVRVRLTPSGAAPLMVDMPVEVDIDAEERLDAVFVPPQAVFEDAGTQVVFIAEGEVARRRIVTTGVANDQGVEIASGIEAGELVITRGQAGLTDGARISVALN